MSTVSKLVRRLSGGNIRKNKPDSDANDASVSVGTPTRREDRKPKFELLRKIVSNQRRRGSTECEETPPPLSRQAVEQAVRDDDWAVLSLEFEAGRLCIAELSPEDALEESLLHLACEVGSVNVATFLASNGGRAVNCTNTDGDTPLHHAAYHGHADILEVLLRQDANLNARNDLGSTALHMACVGGKSDCVRWCVHHKVSALNTPNALGSHPLHLAIESGDLSTVMAILSLDTTRKSLSAPDSLGQTPLTLACEQASYPIVECLLQRGADVDQKGTKGLTPLMVAASVESLGICDLLLVQYNANPNLTTPTGDTASGIAALKGARQIVDLIHNHCEIQAEKHRIMNMTEAQLDAEDHRRSMHRELAAELANAKRKGSPSKHRNR